MTTSKNLIKYAASLMLVVSMMLSAISPIFADDGKSDLAAEAGSTLSGLVAENEELPVIHLSTSTGRPVTTKQYRSATMQMTLSDRFSEYENAYTSDKGAKIQIKCRGNSTFTVPGVKESGKYSYKIKLGEKADLLGMGESRHWALISNYFDVTNMRNKLTYDLSGMMGMPYCESRWVVVYFNGEYKGLYSLVESLRIDEGRVDITDWEDRAKQVAKAIARAEGLSDKETETLEGKMENDLSWITSGKFEKYKISDYYDTSSWNINSGYLIEYDNRMDSDSTKFKTAHGKPIEIDSPSAVGTNPEMVDYIKGLLDDFEEAIYSPSFCTADGRHYSEFLDVDSTIDYQIIFNLFKNIEFGFLSIFLYIEDGKIHFGPCWDFDNASGNQVTLTDDWMLYDKWFYIDGRAEWWNELLGDPAYVVKLEDRWFEIRTLVDDMLDSMDVYYKYIYDEAVKNFETLGPPANWYIRDSQCKSFQDEYNVMKDWMYKRVEWLDEQWSLRDPNMENAGLQHSDRMTLKLKGTDGELVTEAPKIVGCAPADYLLKIDGTGDLTLTITTEHTSHRFAEVYVNGKKIGRYICSDRKTATVKIRRSDLDLTDGKINVIYVAMVNHENNYYRNEYLTVRASAEPSNDRHSYSLKLGDQPLTRVKKDSTVTLPETSVKYTGYKTLGWTDGDKIYPEGSEYTVGTNTRLWVKIVRTDLFPDRVEEEPIEPTYPTTPEPTIPEPTIPEEPQKKKFPYAVVIISTVVVLVAAGAAFILISRKKQNKEDK